jgi:predicted XRE-type DNA-binding protein
MWRSIQDDMQMLKNGVKLSEQKMKTIKHWIENNALYQKHTECFSNSNSLKVLYILDYSQE